MNSYQNSINNLFQTHFSISEKFRSKVKSLTWTDVLQNHSFIVDLPGNYKILLHFPIVHYFFCFTYLLRKDNNVYVPEFGYDDDEKKIFYELVYVLEEIENAEIYFEKLDNAHGQERKKIRQRERRKLKKNKKEL